MRVALAQFIYESNTFNPELAEMSCFTERGVWLTEPAAIKTWARGTDTQLQRSMEVLAEAGHESVPVMVAVCGAPGGRMSAACHDALKSAFLDGLRGAGTLDAMVLHLHGAVAAEGIDDVEGDWLGTVRQELGFTGPLVVSLDLHANVTAVMLEHADAITAYRTAPHEDFAETGERAAQLLLDLPESTTRTMAKIAALIPPTSTHHEVGPFAEMLNRARDLQRPAGILDVSLFPVQPWLDVEGLGTSVVVTATDPAEGQRVAQQLAEGWYAQRFVWPTGLLAWDELQSRLEPRSDGPWLLVDTADATTGGSDGSSLAAVREFWPRRDNLVGTVLLWVVAPEMVSDDRKVGAQVQFDLPDLTVTGELTFAGECQFRPRGKAYTGQLISCGRAQVVASGQLRVIFTERGCLCSDPAFYEAVGLDPEGALAVHVKSLLGWQAGFGVGPERGLYFDGPGMTSLNFARLSFTGARRELWPINPSPPNPISLWQSI